MRSLKQTLSPSPSESQPASSNKASDIPFLGPEAWTLTGKKKFPHFFVKKIPFGEFRSPNCIAANLDHVIRHAPPNLPIQHNMCS